jgi:acyl-CoA synthetase (AMP-forming)/AMP-acid ligase II
LFFDAGLTEKLVDIRADEALAVTLVSTMPNELNTLTLQEAYAYYTADEPEPYSDPESLSRIQYTGGSSGIPKGAARTHLADLIEIDGILDSNGLGDDPDNIVLIQCPLEHHGGHSWFTITFATGATLMIFDVFDADRILEQIERHHVTYMILLPPSTYLRLLSCPSLGKYDLSSVRLVQSSAGGTTKEVVQKIYEAFPQAILNYGWGQSESGLGTSLVITREMLSSNSSLMHSIGKPTKNLEIRIVDDEGNDLSAGKLGEALVRSPAVMNGYYGQDELTATVFTDDGWLHTGDMMEMDEDGYLFLRSRKKDIIKSGGENVFVAEVEKTIHSHPAVADCIVFGTSDAVLGEAVAAVVQLRPDQTLTASELRTYCKRFISSFKKPRYVHFVNTLGRDDAGKVRKQQIIQDFERVKPSFLLPQHAHIRSDPDNKPQQGKETQDGF